MSRHSVFPTLLALLVLPPDTAIAFQQPARPESLSFVKAPSAWALSLQNNSLDGPSSSSSGSSVGPGPNSSPSPDSGSSSRRDLLRQAPSLLALVGAVGTNFCLPQSATAAAKLTGVTDGNLPELPFEASRSYLQYRFALQVAADYYVFDLQSKVADIDEWGEINQIFQTNNNKGQGQPNKV